MAVGCADSGEPTDGFGAPVLADSGSSVPNTGYDAATYPVPAVDASSSLPVVDASSVISDAGVKPSDAGSTATTDAGSVSSDSGSTKPSDAGSTTTDAGGFTIPDIFGEGGIKIPDLFPATDAGSTPSPSSDGGRDVRGPCKDLNLICFDFIDMWINAECQTCNNGKGCQGCNIPFAY